MFLNLNSMISDMHSISVLFVSASNSYLYTRKSIVFVSSFLNRILMNLHVLRFPESKTWVCVCHQQKWKTSTGWPADLEFLETWKSQGILWLLKNVREKSGNFNTKLVKVREFYLREMNIAEVLHKNKLMWMQIAIFKSCTWTPKSGKIFWKG